MVYRGNIYYVVGTENADSEQSSGRPAIVVSNNKCNAFSTVVEVVYLTTKSKTELPTHVTIKSAPKLSVALCEQVTSVSTKRLKSLVGTCSEQEMASIDEALRISLALGDTSTCSKLSKPNKQ